jgi:uncharacterized protein (TIGR02594 family)
LARTNLSVEAEGKEVELLQQLLQKAGHELVDDGEFGPITESAVKMYQAAHGLKVTGRVDAAMWKMLEPNDPLPSVIEFSPWHSTMRAITGTKEVPGSKNSPIIMDWVKVIGERFPKFKKYLRGYSGDSIAWCGLTEAYCMAVNGIEPVEEFLWAQNWAKHGQPLTKPVVGAVLVFKRIGGGHVGHYESESRTHYVVRGGNQSDAVNLTKMAKSQLVKNGIRWVPGYPMPGKAQKVDLGAIQVFDNKA